MKKETAQRKTFLFDSHFTSTSLLVFKFCPVS
jgi:hypothetical protein